jgi:hypothetical protein
MPTEHPKTDDRRNWINHLPPGNYGANEPLAGPDRKGGGRLTTEDRHELPGKDFALPGRGKGPEGKGSGSYPIPDVSHGRNALARVSQHGSPAEKAKVQAAVHRKFPGIKEG